MTEESPDDRNKLPSNDLIERHQQIYHVYMTHPLVTEEDYKKSTSLKDYAIQVAAALTVAAIIACASVMLAQDQETPLPTTDAVCPRQTAVSGTTMEIKNGQ